MNRAAWVPTLLRSAYRYELIPVRARWWLAAAGMCDWYRTLVAGLRPLLPPSAGEARSLLARLSVRMFERRYDALVGAVSGLPDRQKDPRAVALLMAELYRLRRRPKADWILEGLGGPPRGPREWLRGKLLVSRLSPQARWQEMATHLGELLIVLTEDLPAHLPHARKALGDLCYAAGQKFAERVQHELRLSAQPADPAAAAIEVLRMSEYIFHVNPTHSSHTEPGAHTGWLEGTACPWYQRPGWHAGHCGIFGQFQSGISSAFGLRYHLSQTIPKHGGSTCRIDLKPIQIRVVSK
jgi:hypothetical protein